MMIFWVNERDGRRDGWMDTLVICVPPHPHPPPPFHARTSFGLETRGAPSLSRSALSSSSSVHSNPSSLLPPRTLQPAATWYLAPWLRAAVHGRFCSSVSR